MVTYCYIYNTLQCTLQCRVIEAQKLMNVADIFSRYFLIRSYLKISHRLSITRWPPADIRSGIWKITEYVVQLGELSTPWKFEINRSEAVGGTSARKLKLGSDIVPLFVIWWPDLTSQGPKIFRTYVERLPHRLHAILRRCKLPFLHYLWEISGGCINPSPGRARVNKDMWKRLGTWCWKTRRAKMLSET